MLDRNVTADATTQQIVAFVMATDYRRLKPSVVDAICLHHLDGIGCAAGAVDSQPARVARAIARDTSGPLSASVYGLAERTQVEYAAFANGCMNRYLDYNDTGGPGHPNDMAPALLALTEATGGSGADLILAIYIAYEVAAALARACWVRDLGWDQGFHCSLAAAAAMAKVLKLDATQTANALSLAITPSIPLRVVRTGELSNWKGCATAHAAMTAMFATRLAQHGLTGPPTPFSGVDGVFERVTGPFELDLSPRTSGPSAVERTMFKHLPAEFNSQLPLQMVLDLARGLHVDDIDRIEIATYFLAWHEIGGGQGDAAEKWDPRSRETADHSLPYLIAVALTDKALTPESFTPARVGDPRLRPLMRRIEVREDPDMTRRRKGRDWPTAVTIHLKDGRVLHEERARPHGHLDDPMTRDEVVAKFDRLIDGVLPADSHMELKARLLGLQNVRDLDDITQFLRRFSLAGRARRRRAERSSSHSLADIVHEAEA